MYVIFVGMFTNCLKSEQNVTVNMETQTSNFEWVFFVFAVKYWVFKGILELANMFVLFEILHLMFKWQKVQGTGLFL